MLAVAVTGEKWTVESLADGMKFDHGYSRDSAVIGWLLRVLAGLDAPDQHRFLRFVTGSPRLPPGGLAALQVCPSLLFATVFCPLKVICFPLREAPSGMPHCVRAI